MTTAEIEALMKESGVRMSPVRILVAKAISDAPGPVSGLDIECLLATVDRSSITRALSLFVSSGLVHSIDDGSGSMKYELCHKNHLSKGDSDLHPHFHCVTCGRTFCLSDQAIPVITLPPGFLARSANLVIKGLCSECANRVTQV